MSGPTRRLVLWLGVLLMACGGGGGRPTLAGRTFLSESAAEGGGPRELLPGTRIRLTFHDDGRLSASAGCNTLGAGVEIEQDRIVVGDLSTTQMCCDPARHQQDEWLAGVLTADPGYVLDQGRLRLSTRDTRIDLVDRTVADPARPLEATVWKLDGIIAGDAVSSVPAAVAATVVFSDGRVGMKVVGCNSGGADVTISGDAMDVGPLVTTRIACGEPAASVESAIAAVLDGRITYRIDGAALTLRNPSGGGLVLRAGS